MFIVDDNIFHITVVITLNWGSTMEKVVGEITHYFPKVGVAVVMLEDTINNGDRIHVKGTQSDFYQTVTSMQIEHQTIQTATKGQDLGMKVSQVVHAGDVVYKVE